MLVCVLGEEERYHGCVGFKNIGQRNIFQGSGDKLVSEWDWHTRMTDHRKKVLLSRPRALFET